MNRAVWVATDFASHSTWTAFVQSATNVHVAAGLAMDASVTIVSISSRKRRTWSSSNAAGQWRCTALATAFVDTLVVRGTRPPSSHVKTQRRDGIRQTLLQELEGYLPDPLGQYRFMLYTNMMGQAKRDLSEEDFKRFHDAY